MTETDAGSRPADARFLAQLPAEVQHWEDSGVISGDQARAILDGYDFPEAAETPRNRLVTVLLIMGAVLVGLGIILFVAANWREIPSAVKLAMMFVGVPAIYGIGFFLRYRFDYQRVGAAVILVGAICYGAAIHLVAQTYQIPVNSPNLVLYWFLGVFPLAYLVRSQPVMVLALVTGLAAVGFRGQEWLLDSDFIPSLAMPLFLALGSALFALGRLQEEFPATRGFTPVFQLIALLAMLGTLYFWGFQDLWDWGGHYGWDYPDGTFFPVTAEFWAIAGVTLAVLATSWAWVAISQLRRGERPDALLTEVLPSLVLTLFAALVVFLPREVRIVYPLAANLLYGIGVVGLAFLGYRRGREALINLSIAFFCIWVFTRYFEFGWDLLDRSVVFIVAGIILLAGGFLLERGRRSVLRRLRDQGAATEVADDR
jgi:uncharacterized membrane protein